MADFNSALDKGITLDQICGEHALEDIRMKKHTHEWGTYRCGIDRSLDNRGRPTHGTFRGRDAIIGTKVGEEKRHLTTDWVAVRKLIKEKELLKTYDIEFAA